MIRIKIEATSTYRLAGQSCEADGHPWHGRLLNTPQLEKLGKATEAGNPVREIGIEIANSDAFINLTTETLWGATVTLYNDDYAETWVGEIRSFSTTGEGVLSIMAAEETLAAFKSLLPDEIVRVSTWTESARDAANTTIPTVFGGTAADPIRVRGILVDRVAFRYLFCVGEIREVVAVLKNREAITTGFTTYTGTAGQSVYPGFAYIEFDADPRDEAGTWPEILADVVGLKLGAATEEECRNPARILQYLLTTTRGGACGWGLGIPSGSLDSTSFTTAISDCDTAGFKIDGALLEQKAASFWIAQITNACRGSLRVVAGKWTLTIDKVSSSVAHYGDGQKKMRLQYFGKGASSERKNRHSLEYRYDATDGRLLGYVLREDSTSQTAIGVNESKATNLLVRDHTAAGYIVDYLSRYETYGENRIEFMTDDFDGVNVDSVITITRSDLGLSAAKFRVVSMRISGGFATIEARGYDDAIFGNDTPGSGPTDPATDPFVPAAAPPSPPAEASGVSLSTGVRVQADGTTIAYVDGVYTMPAAALFVRVEVGEGATPSSWLQVGSFTDGTFHHEPCKPGQNYTYRLFCVNAGGASAAVTANITAEADTTAPGVPPAPTTELLFKSIIVKVAQNATKAPDLAGFEVWRSETADSGDATKVGFVACGGTADGASFLDETTGYGTTYYYFAKAVDKTGNASAFSDASADVTTQGIISGDIAAGALASSDLFACGVVDAAAIANSAVTAAKTCLAAIDQTSGCLTACSVATCNLQAGAITGEKIYAGAITGDKIAGHVISAEHLVIGSLTDNLIWEGSAESGTATGWARCRADATAGPWGISDSQKHSGSYSYVHVGDCSSSMSRAISVTPGEKYRVSFWVKGCAASARGLFLLASRAASMPASGFVDFCVTSFDYVITDAGFGADWTYYDCVYTVPTGTYAVSFNWYSWSYSPAYTYFDEISVRRIQPGTLIEDGAITTAKIAANSICAGHICSGAITTAHLTASGICADCVKAGTLSGVTVCTCTGNIGGWTINCSYLYHDVACVAQMYLNPSCYNVAIAVKNASDQNCAWIVQGKMYWSSAYQNAFGFSVANTTSGNLAAAMGYATGTTNLPDSSTVAANCPFFWVGDSSAYAKYYGGVLTIKGNITATTGTIGGWTITANSLEKYTCGGQFIGYWCEKCFGTTYGPGFYQGMINGSEYDIVSVGRCLYTGTGWISETGISVSAQGTNAFRVSVTAAGVVTALFCGTVYATAGCFTGTVTSTSGNIATLCMDANGLKSKYDNMGMSFVRTYSSSLGKYVGARIDLCGNVSPESGSVGYSFIKLEGGMNGCTTGAVAPIWIDMTASSCYAISTDGRIYASAFCSSSDRLCKSNIRPVDVLPRLRGLPITEWTFSDSVTRRIGPMAQDFFQQFPFYSDSPEAVGGLDGIALKGVQELDGCVGCLQACICSLECRLANLEARLPACA